MPKKSNPDVKIANELCEMTPEDLAELFKCQDDPIHCITTYFKIKHPTKGLVPFELYDYQKEVIRRATKNRFNVILFPRQSGKCFLAPCEVISLRNKNLFTSSVNTSIMGFYRRKMLWILNKLLRA